MSVTTPAAAPVLVDLDALREHLDRDQVRARVQEAWTSTAADLAVTGVPGELLFEDPHGDAHVKYGHLHAEAHFVVKVATGFPGNAAHGLPVSGGVVLLLSKRTGQLQAVLRDGGFLTAWRTAAAGSLASRALAPSETGLLAVIGTGEQAELQALWHADVFPGVPIVIAGRDAGRARDLAGRLADSGLPARAATVDEAVAAADVVVTATSATAPLFPADLVKAAAHVTAVGADGGGKQELDPHLLARADLIATDDHHQCLAGGELAGAVRAGAVTDSADVPLAAVLREAPTAHRPSGITVADLTGLTVQDLAIASYFRERLGLASDS